MSKSRLSLIADAARRAKVREASARRLAALKADPVAYAAYRARANELRRAKLAAQYATLKADPVRYAASLKRQRDRLKRKRAAGEDEIGKRWRKKLWQQVKSDPARLEKKRQDGREWMRSRRKAA